MLFQIAWKNIWRNKVRSLIIMISVVLGIWAGLFIMAYASGMINQRLEDAIENEISHLQVHHPDFERDYEPKYFIQDGMALLKKLQEDPGIEKAAGRVITNGMVASANTSSGGKLIGIMPQEENEVTGLSAMLIAGEYFKDGDKNKAIIGEKLANKLKVRLRSKVVLTSQDKEGNIVAGAFRIIGLYKTYNSSFDETNVFVKAEDLANLIWVSGQIHEIAALVNEPRELGPFIDQWASGHPATSMKSWKEISPELGLMIESFDQYLIIFIVIILLALSFGIINTMLMAVLERVREIGMLMAIGMNKFRLFGMIMLETIFLVVISAPVGLLLAFVTIQYLGAYGLDLSAMYQEGYATWGFKSIIYPVLDNVYYGQIMIMVVITAILASIYPAITAIRLNPVEAIRKI